jgi:Domain of unknown function (DUF5658)
MLTDQARFSKTLRIGVAVFLMLSVIDFALTWRLVTAAHSEVDEINPVASWVLENFGWVGLAAYKLTLVSSIGIAVLIIASRRQALGTSVIMFGCGAQASVVITALMLLHNCPATEPIAEIPTGPCGGDETNLLLPPAAFALLLHEQVQRELGLSAAVIDHITRISQRRDELRRRLRAENISIGYDIACDLYGQERLLAQSISPKQQKRLQQLCWQLRGELSFWEPNVIDSLEFSIDQIDVLHRIQEESDLDNVVVSNSRNGNAPVHKGAANLKETKSRLLAVLDQTQREKWREMQGEPFQLDRWTTQATSSPAVMADD